MYVAISRRVNDSIPHRSGKLNWIYGLKIKLKLDVAELFLSGYIWSLIRYLDVI